MTLKLFKDKIHAITAMAPSSMMAWMLIRNECHERKIEIPTLDKIEFIKDLSDEEVKYIYSQNES
jgi:hypothetical protein